MIAETLKIPSLSFESLILVISFFISNLFILNFEIIEVSSAFVFSLITEVFFVSFLIKVFEQNFRNFNLVFKSTGEIE